MACILWTVAFSATLCTAALLIAPTVYATEVDATQMRGTWWNSKEVSLPNEPCNYVYIAHGKLLYYGTAKKCHTRITQHANSKNHSRVLIEKIQASSSAQTAALMKQSPLKAMPSPYTLELAEWTIAVDKSRTPVGNGTSEACLQITSSQYGDEVVWFLPMSSKANADAVEDCVLEKMLGYCNRRGNGDTRSSWKDFDNKVRACVKENGG